MEKTYEVICDKCKGASLVGIRETSRGKIVNWLKIGKVISARERLDMQMGWQCYCGNNTLLTKQETKEIKNHAQPEVSEIKSIVANLRPELKTGFKLKAI